VVRPSWLPISEFESTTQQGFDHMRVTLGGIVVAGLVLAVLAAALWRGIWSGAFSIRDRQGPPRPAFL
jgi:hypothetical protein